VNVREVIFVLASPLIGTYGLTGELLALERLDWSQLTDLRELL
jgi:hypothetical protein